jgi:Barstar (barnase inhibitor)
MLFSFGDEHTSGNVAAKANIPENITRKHDLLAALAIQLSFPGYFGWNGTRSMNASVIYPGYQSAQ